RAAILAANREDVDRERADGMNEALIDRLTLTDKRIDGMADGVLQVASLPDPVGETVERFERPNGLKIRKVKVPLGVIGMIYEARPNVTVDAAALTLKSGNCVLLRGSRSARRSNEALTEIIRSALVGTRIPEDAVILLPSDSHESVDELMSQRSLVDLIIPRGGAGLIKSVAENSRVPVLETGVGNCHVYVDRDADGDIAENVCVNAKISRPSVCNAAESFLFHRERPDLLARVCSALRDAGVTLHGCPETVALFPDAICATEDDYGREYLSLDASVKVVGSVGEAIEHIRKYGTGHTEAIITENDEAARRFEREVDAACVNRNASTRFTDGGEFGFGAEIGISTQKLHARGPVGLRELTSYKYVVTGNGQTR
ncbi:MAG: glutamate-5-semialdehyde dehydrogenase, partial [Clostridia bacterium]|nr:glutamate-5-semialdehyde dehydrogenase [Clostridia bacterium]